MQNLNELGDEGKKKLEDEARKAANEKVGKMNAIEIIMASSIPAKIISIVFTISILGYLLADIWNYWAFGEVITLLIGGPVTFFILRYGFAERDLADKIYLQRKLELLKAKETK